MKTEDIARVCHDANRAYCLAFGDDSQVTWEHAADWQRASAIKGVEYAVANPEATADAQHNAWLKDKQDAGWVYGGVKDAAAKTHPCIVPYEQLPGFQKGKDALFLAVVRALAPLED